jgi:hypothetical protein
VAVRLLALLLVPLALAGWTLRTAQAGEPAKGTPANFSIPDYMWLDAMSHIAPSDRAAGSGLGTAAPAVPPRRLQLNGTALKVQVNKLLTIEGGWRLGLGDSSSGPLASGSPGAFIRLQRAFQAR